MKQTFTILIILLMAFALTACGKPTAPESPDSDSYGQTIQPDHNVPADHQ